jgi:hypothetical protein
VVQNTFRTTYQQIVHGCFIRDGTADPHFHSPVSLACPATGSSVQRTRVLSPCRVVVIAAPREHPACGHTPSARRTTCSSTPSRAALPARPRRGLLERSLHTRLTLVEPAGRSWKARAVAEVRWQRRLVWGLASPASQPTRSSSDKQKLKVPVIEAESAAELVSIIVFLRKQ